MCNLNNMPMFGVPNRKHLANLFKAIGDKVCYSHNSSLKLSKNILILPVLARTAGIQFVCLLIHYSAFLEVKAM